MSWNYRVVSLDEEYGPSIAVYEVYYDKKGGSPTGWAAPPSTPRFDDMDELREYIERLQDAVAKPILTIPDFGPD